jgi:membrane protein implicated in regulation of membrane protease activity
VGQTLGCLGILSAGKLFGKSLYDSRFKYVNPTVAAGLNLILGVLLTNGAWLGAGICSLLLGIAAALVFGFVGMPGVWCLIWPATYGAMFAVYYVLARWWDAEAPSRIRVVRGQQVLDGQKHAQELANRKRWKV